MLFFFICSVFFDCMILNFWSYKIFSIGLQEIKITDFPKILTKEYKIYCLKGHF